MSIEKEINDLGEWKHSVNINGVNTRDINPDDTPVEYHPAPRWKDVKRYISDDINNAVDLGCAECRISFELEEMGIDVTSVEGDNDVFERASYAKDKLDSDITLIQDDVVEFLRDSDGYDLVLALGLVYHVEEIEELLDLIQDKADKKWIIETTFRDRIDGIEHSNYEDGKVRWKFSRKWITDQLSNVGFDLLGGGGNGYRYLIVSDNL